MDNELLDLQMHCAHLEHMLQELSTIVYQQQKSLDTLNRELKMLKEQCLLGDNDKPVANIPPPHY